MSATHQRTIFRSGEYVRHFRPEDASNPFHRIYSAKRHDVMSRANRILANRQNARVLDLGGGMGRIAVPLAACYQVDLCDISEAMLEQAREAAAAVMLPAEQLRTTIVDASQPLPFEDNTFDLLVCLDLLVHLPDPAAAVREMYRVLKPGGIGLIDASNSVPLWVLFYPRYVGRQPRRWLGTLRYGGVLPEWAGIVHHTRRHTFLGWLRAAGFAVDSEHYFGPAPIAPKWILAVARKDEHAE